MSERAAQESGGRNAAPRRLGVGIDGFGAFVPERVVRNEELGALCDVSDEWVRTRTGIRERRIVGEGENTLTMAAAASREAIADAGLQATDIDLIVLGTCTPYTPLPSTACFLQHELGCRQIPAFDLAAACSGFVYSFVTAAQAIVAGSARTALVVGAETMSSVSNYEDRSSGILLGDGAGAVVLTATDDPERGLFRQSLGADGKGAEFVWIPSGGSRKPASHDSVDGKEHLLRMNGREVYKFVVGKMQNVIDENLEAVGISMDDLALIVPHQSNQRIMESVMEKLSIPAEKMAINIDRYGNTSAASIPLALCEAVRAGRVQRGDWVLLAGFGSGMTWATALLRL